MRKANLFVIMGVSGTGKTTIGRLLSEELGLPFFDGDDFHPEANITKMASGKPLNDEDRRDWLIELNNLLKSKIDVGGVLACSALKNAYRITLCKGVEGQLHFIYLKGSIQEVKSRMEQREDHFMPLQLLQSQFDALEEPTDEITVSIMDTPKGILKNILGQLRMKNV